MLVEDACEAVMPESEKPSGTPAARRSVRLELPSRIEMVDAADRLIEELASAAGFPRDPAHDIQLAAHEAVINAIVHGNHRDGARRVTMVLTLRPFGLEIRVRDGGQGFDPASVPDPLAPENVCRTSGRGLLMMRRLMDEVTFRPLAGGGTEVKMLKRFQPKHEVREQRMDVRAG